jgi:hypothetical protein
MMQRNRAAKFNGLGENLADGLPKFVDLGFGQLARWQLWAICARNKASLA